MKSRENDQSQVKTSILTYNIPLDTSAEELKTLFGSYGNILMIKQFFKPWNMNTYNAKIFYEHKEEAKTALEALHGAKLDENVLKIIFN